MRDYDQQGANKKPAHAASGNKALSKYAHAVIFVVKANDPRLKDGKYKDTLLKIREHFRKDGNSDMCHKNHFFYVNKPDSRSTDTRSAFCRTDIELN